MRLSLLGLVALTACAACTAQPANETPGDEPVEAFFARFQAAVRDHDLDALTDMARFPLVGAEVDREAFVTDLYPTNLREGAFRDVLLAATADDLEAMEDGSYRYMALVSYNEEGEAVADGAPEAEYESAILFTFRPDGEGGWYLAEVWFAG
jgi:hypothetical protein